MLRLSQMTGGYLTDDAGSITSVSTAKLDALSDILDTMLAEEKKLVILARFAPELDGIQELQDFADKLEKATLGTIESGKMTKDLALITSLENVTVLNSEGFIKEIAEKLK